MTLNFTKIVTDKTKLRIPLREVTLSEDDLKKLSEDMFQKLRMEGGVGLAANQLGVNERVCVIKVKEPIFLVNPVIIESSADYVIYYEGCLSFPNTKKKPKRTLRYKTVKVIADNYSGPLSFQPDNWEWTIPNSFWLDKGMLECVAVQHEISHLNGDTIYEVLATPPIKINENLKHNRNDKVMFMNKSTGETRFIKYKKGLLLLERGWEVV